MPSQRQSDFYDSIAYHKVTPDSQDVVSDFQILRDAARVFGDAVFSVTDGSREQSLALTHIEDALMWATKQVAVSRLPVAR